MADLTGIPQQQLVFLAVDADERRQHAKYLLTKAEEDYGAACAELLRREPGEGEAWVEGDAVVAIARGRGTNRSVNREGILAHAESLEPLGLVPREKVSLTWPTLAQLDAADYVIRRAGLDPAELVVPGTPGGLEVRIKQREMEVTP